MKVTRKNMIATLLSGALLMGAAMAAPAASAGESPSPRACSLVANVWKSGNYAIFQGGRQGCSSAKNVTVQARRDIAMWPDQELSRISFSAANGARELSIWGTSGHLYFTQTQTDDGEIAYSTRLKF